MDDIILIGDDDDGITDLNRNLSSEFDIKDLNYLKLFFGHICFHSRHGTFLFPHKYAVDLRQCTRKLGAKPIDAPLGINNKLQKDVGDLLENHYIYGIL